VRFAESTQLAPVNTVPIDRRRRGPNLSTKYPWNGEKKVCNTIKIEKVICSSVRVTPSWPMMGFVNKAQTYCGLEIDIMQITPRANCTHLDFRGLVKVVFTPIAAELI
jgi:hypothetical protein